MFQTYLGPPETEPPKSPVALCDSLRDKIGLDLLSCASEDWRFGRHRDSLAAARSSGDRWEWWGQIVYCVGAGENVHLSQSPENFEELGDFATITARQLDAILADFVDFQTHMVPFERDYEA